MAIDLSEVMESPKPIDLGASAMLSPDAAASKAYKAAYGLGPILGLDYQQLYEKMLQPEGEDNFRKEAAATIDSYNAKERLDRARYFPETVTHPIAPIDPSLVLETAYAYKFVDEHKEANTNIGWNNISDAETEIPEQHQRNIYIASEIATRQQVAATLYHKAEAALSDENFAYKAWDFLKAQVPVVAQAKEFGTVGFAGSKVEKDIANWFGSSSDEFKNVLVPQIEKLIADNPILAKDYIAKLMHYSLTDKELDNFLGPLDLSVIPAGAILRRSATLFNSSRGLMKGMIKGMWEPGSTRVNALKAAGDATGSAMQMTVEDLAKAGTFSDQFQQQLKTLTTYIDFNQQVLEKGKGNISREAYSMIQSGLKSMSTDFMNMLVSSAKIEKNVIGYADKDMLAAVKNVVEDSTPWWDGRHLDVNGPFPHPITNHKYWEVHLGTTKGELFSNEAQARTTAKDLGLLEPTVVQKKGTEYTRDQITEMRDAAQNKLDSIDELTDYTGKRRPLEKEIKKYNRFLNDQNAQILEVGGGWKIVVPYVLPDKANVMRDLMREVPQAVTPQSFWHSVPIIGRARSPEETLAAWNNHNRKVAVYTPNTFIKYAEERWKAINQIQGRLGNLFNKRMYKEFDRFVQSGQEATGLDGIPGKWYDFDEMKTFYRNAFDRAPTDYEYAAYSEFKNLVEMDRIFRNMEVLKHLYSAGAESHRLYKTDAVGKKYFSNFFNGIRMHELPGTGDHGFMYTTNKGTYSFTSHLTQAQIDDLAPKIKSGELKLIRVFDPTQRPLKEFAKNDGRIRYIITDKAETKPLDWNQVPNRGGGHIEHEFDYSIKQGIVKKDSITGQHGYEGDRTFGYMTMKSPRAAGAKFVKTLNDIVTMHFLENRTKEARDLYNKTVADLKWEDFIKQFSGDGPRLSPDVKNTPFHLVPRDRMVINVDPDMEKRFKNFRDYTKTGNDAAEMVIKFTGQRDVQELHSIEDVGSKVNPIWKFTRGKPVDPLPMMSRSLQQAINSYFMDDIKASSILHWVNEASPYLKAEVGRDIAKYPYHYFNAAEGKGSFKPNVDDQVITRFMNNKERIDQFIGIRSKSDAWLESVTQDLADRVYNKFGPGKAVVVPMWLVPRVKDPFTALRSMVFDMKVGLFSIPQFFVHLTTYSTVLGVAGPRTAMPGTLGGFLSGYAAIAPRTLEKLDNIATHFGWKPGEFMEAHALQKSTGFSLAEYEHAMIDDVMRNRIALSNGRKFLDFGRVFFRSGLRMVRSAAWYTAYREFRNENPLAVIGNVERNMILDRADLLAHNMSRASSSFINRGVWSLPFQFQSYQQRLAEIMLGTRTDWKTKASLFVTNATLFGLPVAGSLSGAPISDIARSYAYDNGYNPGANFFSTSAMEGMISSLYQMITGGGDTRKGTSLNFGTRFGTKGMEGIETMFRQDQGWMKAFGGASIETLAETASSLYPFWLHVSSAMKTLMGVNHDNEIYPLTKDDWLDPLKNVAGYNLWDRFIKAVKTGQWMTRKGAYLGDVDSVTQAIIMSSLGVSKTEFADSYLIGKDIKAQHETNDQVKREFIRQYERAIRAEVNGDTEQHDAFMKQAMVYLHQSDYPANLYGELWSSAVEANISIVEKAFKTFRSGKQVPQSKKIEMLEALKVREEMERLKGKRY